MPKKPPREQEDPNRREETTQGRGHDARTRKRKEDRDREGECPPGQENGEARYPDPRQWERPPAGPPADGEWRDELDGWVANRKKKHAEVRERDECGRDRGKRRMPRPWLTYGVARWFELRDHGMALDDEPGDGWYTGGYAFRSQGYTSGHRRIEPDRPGTWYLFVFAQDVNVVTEGTAPFEAAHTIGGFVLTDQLELQFDQPCKLPHDAVIQVV